MSEPEIRKIIHIDMDAFFASVEQRDNPSLRKKPVAVGGSAARGVVAAASYEARRYGVTSAMPSRQAAKLCPNLIFVSPRFDAYKKESMLIQEIFAQYTDLVEPLSLDEAYLDVTHNKLGVPSATLIAEEIRTKIHRTTQLTASAGISFNKFLAKTASDVNKPNGQFLIHPSTAEAYVDQLPIKKFHGIGKVTAEKMSRMGIFTGKDLKRYSAEDLTIRFGKVGGYYYQIARGIDTRPVNPNRIRKSIGAEYTSEKDLRTMDAVVSALSKITHKVAERMNKADVGGKTLTLKIKFSDFSVITRSHTVSEWIKTTRDIEVEIPYLLEQAALDDFNIRLLGLSISQLSNDAPVEVPPSPSRQLTLNF